MSLARKLRRFAQRDAGTGIVAGTPLERFAKKIAQALAELGASGATTEEATVEMLRYAGQFAAYHEVTRDEFVEAACAEYDLAAEQSAKRGTP